MILNFKYDTAKEKVTWRFKAQNQGITVKNPQIVKCYEYLDRIFVLTLENKVSVLYVYGPEGELIDKIVSTKDFFISGIRGGIIEPEFIVRAKGKEPKIYIYNAKKRKFTDTGEVVEIAKKEK